MSDTSLLWAESMFGAKTRRGLVRLSFRGESVIISPDEARTFASTIYEAASAAEGDECLMRWLHETFDFDEVRCAAALKDFREQRVKQMTEKKARPPIVTGTEDPT